MKHVFQYRTHMLEFNANYRNIEEYIKVCPICKSHPDDQDSLEDCVKLKTKVADLEKLKTLYNEKFDFEIAKKLTIVLNLRKEMIDETNVTNEE